MREVLLTQRAQEELDEAHHWWAENRSAEQANRWYLGFLEAMLTLEHVPFRWPFAPENDYFPYEVRQLNFGLGSRPHASGALHRSSRRCGDSPRSPLGAAAVVGG